MQRASMDNNLHIVQPVTSARLKAIHLNILSDEDAVKISASIIGTVNEMSDAALGLPTTNATEWHFGLINFPFTILNPYFMSEVAQILNKICPGCKSIRRGNVKGKSKYGYPRMKFKVSSKDVFAKTAIIAEVHEMFVNKSSDWVLASDYWDIIPKDPSQAHEGLPANKRVLSPAQIRSEKLSNLQKIYEKQSSNDSASSASGLKNIKELLLGKRTDHSLRMVVVGDPRIKVNEIGLPTQIAENVLISDHINIWNWGKLEQCCEFMLKEKGNFSVLRNGQRVCIWSKDMLQKGDSICRHLLDGDIVLINRPPSIHQHSLIALSVKILPINSVASINPLICSPLRGDFDGDCLHGYVPQSVNSRVELTELVSLDKQLVNGQDGRNLLSLSQDSLSAAYLLLENGVLLNKTEIQQLQMFCPCIPVLPAIIKPTSRSSLWTGKQLFSLLLPPDFEFAYESNGCLLRHNRDRALDFLNAGQEVLCEWLISKNLLDEIHYGLEEAEKLSEVSLLMVGGNEDLLNLVYKHCGSNNSFMAMLKAGSKGNLQKLFQHSIVHKFHGSQEISDSYIPCTMVASSYLAGLNPLECFVLSLTTRDSSFGGHADVSGTLTRRLMFFMRDLINGYDGTVRSCHGNHVVQFNYCTKDLSDASMGGHPVGSLAACAISEAAYSALDQPVSVLEPSPLLTLKKVLDCGVKKSTGSKSASLFLSGRLRRWANGFEYGALEVKDHLESLLFSDIVSEVKIWITENFDMKRKMEKASLKVCSEVDTRQKSDSVICISAALSESLKGFSDLDILRDMVKPVLLQTVIKGFPEFKKVDILWKAEPNHPKSTKRPLGEPFLRVVTSEYCQKTKFWSILMDKCLRIRNIIDWERSHPDDIHDCSEAYGIDVGWQCFVNSLHSAISDTGKTILPEHLVVTANCLSATGEFIALNAKGLAEQRKAANVCSPFSQACFSNPSDCLVKAAKMGQMDRLQGSLEALSWGQTPSVGTGCHFDIVYNGKGHEPAKPTDVYTLLSTHVARTKPDDPMKQFSEKSIVSSHFNTKTRKSLLTKMASQHFSEVGIRKISQRLKRSEHGNYMPYLMVLQLWYPMNSKLSGEDKSTAIKALQFHPRWEDKIGTGVLDIKVGRHPDHNETCFFLVRTDGTEEDFSYNKCIHHALEIIAPEKASAYRSRKQNLAQVPTVQLG
ncbi:hypothetical protein DH2020_028688 [Rehmannia glutinosa]|uniref:DNA-directed RNA polymerase n=1 Tax=Rehmannia glutinosa TaxID=99300 RepID=A0ABR0VSE9_REHGL